MTFLIHSLEKGLLLIWKHVLLTRNSNMAAMKTLNNKDYVPSGLLYINIVNL